jgi:hypothetical protein
MFKNDTWDLVELPPNKITVGCRWVYGLSLTLMVLLIGKKLNLWPGYAQKRLRGTSAPGAKKIIIKLLINLQHDLMDVKNVFRNGILDEEDYKGQPEALFKLVMRSIGRTIIHRDTSIYPGKPSRERKPSKLLLVIY